MQPEINAIQLLLRKDLVRLEKGLKSHLSNQSALAEQVCKHINSQRGKRIRASLVMLTARAFVNNPCTTLMTNLASIVELIHQATLLHDDVVDQADYRRGKKAAHIIWGNRASILSGDFLFSTAFQLISTLDSLELVHLLANTTYDIVQGELKQLETHRQLTLSQASYLEIIGLKTAKLFSVACQLGAACGQANNDESQAAQALGYHLGVLFQIKDDVLDYSANNECGKPNGLDFQERKPTLPLIIAYEKSNEPNQKKLQQLFKDPLTQVQEIMPFINDTHALEYCHQQAQISQSLALQALDHFPHSAYSEALRDLISFAYQRNH